jgi:hypothetical protein
VQDEQVAVDLDRDAPGGRGARHPVRVGAAQFDRARTRLQQLGQG